MKDKRIDCQKVVPVMCTFEMTFNFYLAKIKTISSFTNYPLRQVLEEKDDS